MGTGRSSVEVGKGNWGASHVWGDPLLTPLGPDHPTPDGPQGPVEGRVTSGDPGVKARNVLPCHRRGSSQGRFL